MKKIILLFAAFAMTVAASAQTVQESKTFDNFYIGVNGGVTTFTKGHSWMSDLNPNAGLRIGRYFTPVFGLAVESNAYFAAKPVHGIPSTTVKYVNTSLLGTVNLSNWFGGYKGEPRLFEVVALYGLGWGHMFSTSADRALLEMENAKYNDLTSKAAIDFVFNLGAKKAWQFYIEPAIMWNLDASGKAGYGTMPLYNLNNSAVQLNAGFIYKFKNSNGTHNFKIAELRDQAEIDALNAQINSLKEELAKKPKEVVKEVVKEVAAPAPVVETREVKVENLVFVTFAQGKSALTPEAKKALNEVGDKLPEADKKKVEDDLKALKSIIESTDIDNLSDFDVEKLKSGREKLMTSAQNLFSKLYEQNGPGANAGTGTGTPNFGDDVVDGDFKEV